mmetsp:Transcript_21845/g.36190  ORF Transcript_21845/g.36190 Transcript_21845/m.36190 type:complete len:331 (-) Transcript_21845:361-1353(-)
MQGDNAISIQMSLHGVQTLLHGADRALKVTQLPQGVRVSLGAHHISALANPLRGVALKRQRNEASGLRDGVVPNALPGVHGCGDHDKGEIRQHALALGTKDKVNKGLQHSSLLSRKGTPVLVQVQIRDKNNRPGVGPGFAVEVHAAPVSSCSWEGSGIRCGFACCSDTVVAVGVSGHQGILGIEPRVCLVLQVHFLEILLMTVASIQVANGVRSASNEGRHSTGTLNRCESRAGGPAHLATRAQAPRSWAFGVQVSCEASSAAGSFGSMTHLDCCARRNIEIWVFRLDVLVVPSRDLALHDLCQDARRKLQARGISNLSGWHGVKHPDGS